MSYLVSFWLSVFGSRSVWKWLSVKTYQLGRQFQLTVLDRFEIEVWNETEQTASFLCYEQTLSSSISVSSFDWRPNLWTEEWMNGEYILSREAARLYAPSCRQRSHLSRTTHTKLVKTSKQRATSMPSPPWVLTPLNAIPCCDILQRTFWVANKMAKRPKKSLHLPLDHAVVLKTIQRYVRFWDSNTISVQLVATYLVFRWSTTKARQFCMWLQPEWRKKP